MTISNLCGRWRGLCVGASVLLGACASDAPPPAVGQTEGAASAPALEITAAVRHDQSPMTSQLQDSTTTPADAKKAKKERDHKLLPGTDAAGADPVVQTAAAGSTPTAGLGFDAIGQGFLGTNATPYNVLWIPSDQNIAVGPSEVVEVTNDQIAAFDKTGAAVYGPRGVNILWSGFGGNCEANNDGDPVVRYDRQAGRWVVTQFQVTVTPYSQCVAVSSGPSFVNSTWNRYEFTYKYFNDYPKLSVWPDAYYVTYNMFQGGSFRGAAACALERTQMLVGGPARQICYQLSSKFGGLLAADVDGATLPTHDELLANFTTQGGYKLNLWKFHPNWTTPANSTFVQQPSVTVASFSTPTGIPQKGTSQKLDALSDRLMYRLAYRAGAPSLCASAGTASMVVNHTVSVSGVAGVRWYELRVTAAGNVSLCQQGTYKPDSTSRWMGSIAGDKLGNLAMGFSVSSSSLYPGIRSTGRLATDSAGMMGAETPIQDGGGYQSANRWGDYTSLVVDPTDDCTFWYVDQYEKVSGAWNWSTRVASFKFSGCN